MRNLHNFIEGKYGKESLHLLLEWETLHIKDSDYKNHHRFTLRCLGKDIVPVSVKLKSTIKPRRAKQIIHKAERQLLQDRVKAFNNILHDNSCRLDRCRLRLAALVTPSTIEKCTTFISKVRESRHIKIRDRQVNKFNRLMGKEKDRDLSCRVENTAPTTQPLSNSIQPPAQNRDSNK